jgi:hypothetical protein
MPLLVFTHTLISFFCVLSCVVEVACGAGPDTDPLMRKSPSSVAARSRKYLTGLAFCGFASGEDYCNLYTLIEYGGQEASHLLHIRLDGIIPP